MNKGGGKAGLQDRLGGAVGHAKFMCPICKTAAPSLTSMQVCYHCDHSVLCALAAHGFGVVCCSVSCVTAGAASHLSTALTC
jgi:hypothetical protein